MRAWVEIASLFSTLKLYYVALHVRAWVEIVLVPTLLHCPDIVALHVRAWVEIPYELAEGDQVWVALHVRAWVEMAVS